MPGLKERTTGPGIRIDERFCALIPPLTGDYRRNRDGSSSIYAFGIEELPRSFVVAGCGIGEMEAPS